MYLYRFFKKPDTPNDEIPASVRSVDKYPLYAITNNKKYAERFKAERNMKKFIVMKDEVDKEEYTEYASMNRSSVLELHELLTVKNKYKENQSKINLSMLMTNQEYIMCDDPTINILDEYWWANTPDPYVFNKKINKAMEYIDYNLMYRLFHNSTMGETGYVFLDEIDDYCGPSWDTDNLNYFIAIYGDTFKIE